MAGAAGVAGVAGAKGDKGDQGDIGLPGVAGRSSEVALPGPGFFPEGIAVAPDGTLFIASLAMGQILKLGPNATEPVQFVAPPAAAPAAAAGLIVDAARATLYACYSDFAFSVPAALRSFDLVSGAAKGTFTIPPPGICNDLTLDGAGNVYFTDSVTAKIYRLPVGGSAVAVWSSDAAFAGAPMELTLNGIAWDGAANIYVNKFNDGKLYRIPLGAGGAAGTPVEIVVTPALGSPDGLKALDASTLLVTEGTGALSRVKVTGATGAKQVISNRLDSPATAVVVGTQAWVTEGQIGRMIGADPSPVRLPFMIKRVSLQ